MNNVKFNVNMSALCSMKTGGMAEVCYMPVSADELVQTVKYLINENKRYIVLGNMSNVLIPDGKLEFIPVLTTSVNGYTVEDLGDKADIYVQCGTKLTPFAYDMCKKGYAGMEFAYGIPGTVGGAVFMNAGAYGSEIKNVIKSVDYYDIDSDTVINIPVKECGLDYRTSIFQKKCGIILGARFVLDKSNSQELVTNAKQIMQKRIDKQPLEYPSCGSAFKRPQGFYAGELIEKAGLKGFSVGGACVSEKHAGFVINKGNASSEDVIKLMQIVADKVKEKFGVTLESEIKVLE